MEKISADQMSELKVAFGLFDRDGDRYINVSELESVMRSLGQNPTHEELIAMLSSLSGDKKEKIDFPEFLQIMASLLDEGDTEQEIREAFKVFDRDNNGLISPAELLHVMKSLGEEMTIAEAKDMVNEVDHDKDGMISYDEFKTLMGQKT